MISSILQKTKMFILQLFKQWNTYFVDACGYEDINIADKNI